MLFNGIRRLIMAGLACSWTMPLAVGQFTGPESGMAGSRLGNMQNLTAGRSEVYLSGRIEANASSELQRLRVQIVPLGSRRVLSETNPNHRGAFEIESPTGMHEVRVVTLHGSVIHSQAIQLPYAHTLVIDLRQGSTLAGTNNPISLVRLQHRVPKKAVKEYEAAHDASAQGDRTRALAHLEKAIQIDPLYFEAINNLGVQLIRLERVEEACRMFERAIAIDPADPLAETNLSFALLRLGRFAEAEEAARAGVRADGISPRARFYLAISLLEQRKPRKEILFHLSKASPQLEPARKLMEQLQNEVEPER